MFSSSIHLTMMLRLLIAIMAHTENKQVETPNNGCRRIGTIVQWLHKFIQLIWKGRSNTLHSEQTQHTAARVLTLKDAEIREYFNHPHLLLAPDCHYCDGSLLSILKSKPANRCGWLMRVCRSRATMIQEHQRQLQILTKFFTTTKHNTQYTTFDSTDKTETSHRQQ
jgi:hypothetical protein